MEAGAVRSGAMALLVGLVLAASGPAAPASASVVEALELEELVERSDVVVLGRVVEQRSRWEGSERIVTDVAISVDRTMKGRPVRGEQVVVTVLGGSVGDIGMHVEGEARFETGERAIVFLRRTRAGRLRPVGMAQGALPVQPEAGREVVLPGGAGLALVRNRAGRLLPAPGALLHARPLPEVLDDIRAAVARSGR